MKVQTWWWLVTLSALPCGHSFLSDIGEGLHTDLTELLHLENITYDEFKVNVTYLSKNEFDTRAMGPLYNATKVVINFISNKQAYPEGLVFVSGGNLELPNLRENWRQLVTYYAGSISVLTIALLAAAILPIAGLLWCCCYWCRSNRRRRPFDRKYDACIKAMLALLLIGLITLFIFGVVCAFATETALESSAASAPSSFVSGGSDVVSYLHSASAHSRWLLVHNYRQLQSALEQVLAQGGGAISSRLTQFSRAVSVSTLHRMVMQLDSVKDDLTTVHNLTTSLRLNAEKLNTGLRKVKAQLLQTLAKCDHPQCRRLQEKYKIGQLDTDIQYSQMPDVSGVLGNVSLLLQSRLQSEVSRGYRVLTDLQKKVQKQVDEGVPTVKQALERLGVELKSIADEIDRDVKQNAPFLQSVANDFADKFSSAHDQYGPFRRMAGLIPALALLVMTLLFTLGVLCGVCGRRPDVYGGGDCCDKAAASRTLLIGTGVVFLLGGVVSLMVAIYFLTGITTQRFICDPLTEPEGNRLFADLDKMVNIEYKIFQENEDPNFNLSTILQRCHSNMSVYQTLDLYRWYNLTDQRAQLEKEISSSIAGISPSSLKQEPVVILPEEAKMRLIEFSQSGLSDFNYDTILDALETNITSLSLDRLASQLDLGASELSSKSSLVLELQDSAALLRRYHSHIVIPMREEAQLLNSTALKLRDSVRFDHSSLREAVRFLIGESEAAERFLNTQGPHLVANLSSSFAASMSDAVDEYLDLLFNSLIDEVGRCEPVSNAYNSSRDAICVNMLLPINGYWLSLSWCVLLFIPLMVISVKLAKLYQHLDPYPGPLVEAEYLYDAYADRDNVPLANAYKAEKRRTRVSSESGAASAVASTSDVTLPQTQHARRYNDMAPKHWEEGPPRYHAPTEYERPPPYYYPGPDDRQ